MRYVILIQIAALSCLVHLRELKADYNNISDIRGLAELDGLIRVSLKGNKLSVLDLAATRWLRLETLNLAKNSITELRNPDRLLSLVTFDLGKHSISTLCSS